MCTPETEGGERKKRRRAEKEGVVGEEEGDMPSTCSLGNLSNLKSCQDTGRLRRAPLPSGSSLVHE